MTTTLLPVAETGLATRTDVTPLVRRVCERARTRAAACRVAIAVDAVGDTMCEVAGPEFEALLPEFLDHTIGSCGRGETVFVRVDGRGPTVHVDLVVRGEPQRRGARVLEPFARPGPDGKVTPVGAARRRLEALGGRLRTMYDVGRAVTFRIVLPRYAVAHTEPLE